MVSALDPTFPAAPLALDSFSSSRRIFLVDGVCGHEMLSLPKTLPTDSVSLMR
jgi:hypothetical protein